MTLVNPYRFASTASQNLFQILTTLGYTTSLQFVLDAGEGDSYTSGQSWLDLSGNGQDFYRGSGSGSDSADPTFNGVADALSSAEYFSHDGGDRFTYDTTNEAWMQTPHKDNAALTVIGWIYVPSFSGAICGTTPSLVTDTGFRITITGSGYVNLGIKNAGTDVLLITSTPTALNSGAWNFFAVVVDEAATTGFFNVNGTIVAFTSTYSSPASASATGTFSIGSRGGANDQVPSGFFTAEFAAWSIALTQAQTANILALSRSRFGV